MFVCVCVGAGPCVNECLFAFVSNVDQKQEMVEGRELTHFGRSKEGNMDSHVKCTHHM